MSHFIFDYSNIPRDKLDLPRLFEKIHRCVVDSGVFPKDGIRIRAIRCDDCWIADGGQDKGFINLSVRLGAGRDQATMDAVGTQLFDIMKEHMSIAQQNQAITLSLEMRELADVKFNARNF